MKEPTKLTSMIEAARERQGAHYLCAYISGYCDSGNCTAREIRVKIKTYGAKDPVTLRYPLCGVEAGLSKVMTFDEDQAKEERDARVNVNVQRYVRRNLNNSGWALVPLTLYDDDSLGE